MEYLLYWQKISQKQTSREATLQLGRTKLFKKGIKIGPTPSGGSYKEERFPMGISAGTEREIQRLKKKKKSQIHLLQAEQRETSTDGPSHPVTLHNLKCTCVGSHRSWWLQLNLWLTDLRKGIKTWRQSREDEVLTGL